MPRLLILLTLPPDVTEQYRARLSRLFPELTIDVVSQRENAEPALRQKGFELGARGYVLKVRTAEDLVAAVRAALSGAAYASPFPPIARDDRRT